MRYLIALSLMLISACSGHGVLVTGEATNALDREQVELFYGTLPNCDFDEVAIFWAPGDYYSPQDIIRKFRLQAAELGANALQVHFIQPIGANEFKGQARALRCYRYENNTDIEGLT